MARLRKSSIEIVHPGITFAQAMFRMEDKYDVVVPNYNIGCLFRGLLLPQRNLVLCVNENGGCRDGDSH
jgi:hypothetical protein